MKITYVAPHFPPKYIGGTERVVERLADRFFAKGYTVDVVVVETIGRKGVGVLSHSENWNGITVHRLSLPEAKTSDKFSWTYRHPLIRAWFQDYLNNAKPDLVHFHSGYLISASILEATQSQNLPSIITLHDFWFICPLITLLRANGDLCDKPVPNTRCAWCLLSEQRRFRLPDIALKGVPGDVFSKVAINETVAKTFRVHSRIHDIQMRRNFLKDILETVDLVTSPSDFLRKKFLEYGINPKKFIQLPFGLELNEPYAPRSINKGIDTPLKIGYMGQISHHKGIHILIEAFQSLKVTGPNPELHIFGDGRRWPEYQASLKRLTNHHPFIFFDGPYNAPDVNCVFDSLDLVVVPSIWYENRPTVILEAFSRGKPVITSDLGGMAEMVSHEVNGLRFRTGDAQSLREQLQRVVDDPGILDRLAAGIQPVVSVDDEIDEWEKLYLGLIEQRKNSRLQQS